MQLPMSIMRGSIFAIIFMLSFAHACAQPQPRDETVVIPNFWDRKRKVEQPEIGQLKQIRFLTESDYPPFHFYGPDGELMGFEVDLARAICKELKTDCSIQARRWDGLPDALQRGQGDAIISAMRISAESRRRFAYSASYYRTPARFLVSAASPLDAARVDTLAGRRVGVAEGSTHEAYLKAFFKTAIAVPYPSMQAVFAAVRNGEVDAGFVDGVTAALWLSNGSNDCCRFAGGPFTESQYFGEGAGIAVRRDNPRLLQAIDWALWRVATNGTYTTLYLKYFPVGFY